MNKRFRLTHIQCFLGKYFFNTDKNVKIKFVIKFYSLMYYVPTLLNDRTNKFIHFGRLENFFFHNFNC